jgi:hypothetical protein
MPTTLPIKHLTVDQKLRTMEALWEDLSQREQQVPVPQWHKAVLADRERMLKEGKARFIDWDTAKKRIARRTS